MSDSGVIKQKAKKQDKDVAIIKAIYVIYAIALLLFWLPYGFAMIASFLLLTIGIILPYSYIKKTDNDIYNSHYRWQIRSFWIANVLLFPIAILIMVVVVISYGDMGAFANLTTNLDAENAVKQFISDNFKLLITTMFATFVPAMIWWYGRIYIGYKNIKSKIAIPNPTSWLF